MYRSSWPQNASFHWSPSRILIWWYPIRRSRVEKQSLPPRSSNSSSAIGIGYLSGTVLSLWGR